MSVLKEHGLMLHDLDEIFRAALQHYDIPLQDGYLYRTKEMVIQYNERLSDNGYIRKIGTTIALGAQFEDVNEVLAVKFLTKQVEPILRNYKILGCLKPMFRIDCAVVDLTKKYILGMYLAFDSEDSDYLSRNSRYVCTEAQAPYVVSREEIDEFLYNEQFDKDLENILTK